MDESTPKQIHLPILMSVEVKTVGGQTIAKIKVNSQGKAISIAIENPSKLSGKNKELSESDVEEMLFENCTLLSVFSTRLEFWGHDGFLHSIRGEQIVASVYE